MFTDASASSSACATPFSALLLTRGMNGQINVGCAQRDRTARPGWLLKSLLSVPPRCTTMSTNSATSTDCTLVVGRVGGSRERCGCDFVRLSLLHQGRKGVSRIKRITSGRFHHLTLVSVKKGANMHHMTRLDKSSRSGGRVAGCSVPQAEQVEDSSGTRGSLAHCTQGSLQIKKKVKIQIMERAQLWSMWRDTKSSLSFSATLH